MTLKIKEVDGFSDLKKFVKFPFHLYKNHEYWIPPLIKGELNTLQPETNPSLDNCEWKYLLAYKDGRLAGRIGGIISHRFNKQHKKRYARFCWFDFIDDFEVSSGLMADIIEWAKIKGMESIVGPMGFSTFERQGILCDGFDYLPTFSAAYNFEYYPGHLDRIGFQKDIDYVEYRIKIPSEIPEKVMRIRDLIMKRYELKTLQGKSKKELLPYAKPLFEILNVAYAPLYGFAKLTDKQINYFIKKYFSFIDPDFIVVVLDKNDKLIGFQISVPSLSIALQKARGRLFPFGFLHLIRAMKKPKTLDMMLVGIHPDYQNKGVNAVIMADLQRICNEKGLEFAESNGEMEENEKVQSFWRYYNAKQYKRNRIYSKSLTDDY